MVRDCAPENPFNQEPSGSMDSGPAADGASRNDEDGWD